MAQADVSSYGTWSHCLLPLLQPTFHEESIIIFQWVGKNDVFVGFISTCQKWMVSALHLCSRIAPEELIPVDIPGCHI